MKYVFWLLQMVPHDSDVLQVLKVQGVFTIYIFLLL